MQIHSTSLAIYPASAPGPNSGHQGQAGKATDKMLHANESAQRNIAPDALQSIARPERTKQSVDHPDSIPHAAEMHPANSRIQKALSTYFDTAQQHEEPHSTSLSGIDLFV